MMIREVSFDTNEDVVVYEKTNKQQVNQKVSTDPTFHDDHSAGRR